MLDKYAVECLDRGKGIAVPSLGSFTWQASKLRGRPISRPHCTFSDAFLRAAGISAPVVGDPSGPSQHLASEVPVEDFNFSKAAIRFSQRLTKDHIFSGLRAMVQQMADVVSQGRQVCLELSFGALHAKERSVSFAFSPKFISKHGLSVHAPDEMEAVDGTGAFCGGAVAGGEVTMLNLQGCSDVASAPTVADATAAYYLQDAGHAQIEAQSCTASDQHGELPAQYALASQAAGPPLHGGAVGSSTASALTPRSPRHCGSFPTTTPRSSAAPSSSSGAAGPRPPATKSTVYQDALHREITRLEVRASEAMRDAVVSGSNLQRSMEDYQAQQDDRKRALQDNARCLLQQMEEKGRRVAASSNAEAQQLQERRAKPPPVPVSSGFEIGEELKLPASARGHAQPRFPVKAPLSARARPAEPGQLKLPREEIDAQVQAKRAHHEAAKQRERLFELRLLEAERQHEAALRQSEESARAQERHDLLSAWKDNMRVREVRKNIEALETGSRCVSERLPRTQVPFGIAGSLALNRTPAAPASG